MGSTPVIVRDYFHQFVWGYSNCITLFLSTVLGSGYLTACMAELVGKTGKVVGIDHIAELVELSKANIMKGNADLLKDKRIIMVTGDGRLGYPKGRTSCLL